MRATTVVLFTLLGIIIVAAAAHLVDLAVLETQVQKRAVDHQSEWAELSENVKVVTDIFVTRKYGFYGEPAAKISLYMYSPGDEAPFADRASPLIAHAGGSKVQGIWYSYSRENGEWRLTESSSLTAAECREGAPAAFMKAGVELPESALTRP